jgi:hypothetical protein
VISWFESFAFKCNLYRYTTVGQAMLSTVGEGAPLLGLVCGVFVVGWMYGGGSVHVEFS